MVLLGATKQLEIRKKYLEGYREGFASLGLTMENVKQQQSDLRVKTVQ